MGSISVTAASITTTGDQSAGLPTATHDVGEMLEYGKSVSGRGNERHIIRWINSGIQWIYPQLPDWAFVSTFSISTVSGTAAYVLDSSSYLYRRLVSGTVTLDGYAISGYPHHDWADFKKDNANDTFNAEDTLYIIQDRQRSTDGISYIELFPVPTSVLTLAGSYVYFPGKVLLDEESATIPLPPQAAIALEHYIDWRAAKKIGRSAADGDRAKMALDEVVNNIAFDMNKRGDGAPIRVETNNAPYRVIRDYNGLGNV